MTWEIVSPREAALAILAPRFRNGCETEPPVSKSLNLTDFQHEGVRIARQILARRGGVLIADSVGLGKTFLGLGLIDLALQEDAKVLVTVPASLRKMWRTELTRIDPNRSVRLASHTEIAMGKLDPALELDFIVVDEAHAFRNPHTRRYTSLRRLTRAAQVALLTATPVNNSLSDLYFLLRLFCSDGAFRDLGVGSLKAAIEEERDIDRVLRAVMVRRTRTEVRAVSTSSLSFPRHVLLRAVQYDMPIHPGRLREYLAGLTFPVVAAGGGAEVLRFALLKRLESSLAAIRMSLRRRIRFYEALERALPSGASISPAAFRALHIEDELSQQLVLDEMVFDQCARHAPAVQRAVVQELATLRALQAELRDVPDHKLTQLHGLLRERRGSKTIVFTEFRDTARYLWQQLRRTHAVGMIDGSGARLGDSKSSRRVVVERFAPVANGGGPIHPREAVNVLIATDVLAEGMNLQDADAVVSYDLPWNPVRLIQRSGRVDRIGSPHERVTVYNFIPDRKFDAFIGLARTIRTKVELVRSTIGLERPVLEPEQLVERLRTDSYDVLALLDGEVQADLRRAVLEHPGPARRRCVVGQIGGSSGRRGLIGVERGADWQIVAIDLNTGPQLTGTDPDALLRVALSDADWHPADPCVADRLAAAALSNLAHPPLDRRAPEARLALRLTAQLPRDAPPGVYRRVDDALATLACLRGRVSDRVIAGLAEAPATTLRDLLQAIEKVESDSEKAASWRVTGVLIAD